MEFLPIIGTESLEHSLKIMNEKDKKLIDNWCGKYFNMERHFPIEPSYVISHYVMHYDLVSYPYKKVVIGDWR